MASQAQTEANRRNAQKSTGPRTPEGKTTVSQNALRHGLCADLPLTDDESEDDAHQLLAALIEENQPVGANEEILVHQMAENFFSQKRASYRLTEELNYRDDGEKNTAEIALLLRYHTTAGRGFARALTDLRKLQKERKLQEIGFVPQKVGQAIASQSSVSHPPAAAPKGSPIPAGAPPKIEPLTATLSGQTQLRVEHIADSSQADENRRAG